MKPLFALRLLLAASISYAADKLVHVFILSGQSNMKRTFLIAVTLFNIVLVSHAVGAQEPVVKLLQYTQPDKGLGLNEDPNGKPLDIAGQAYAKGVCTGHAVCTNPKGNALLVLEFELLQECDTLILDHGLSDGSADFGFFYALLDDALFYRRRQTAEDPAVHVELPCSGMTRITLAATVRHGEDNRAVWANARVITKAGDTVYLSDAIKSQGKLNWYQSTRELGRVEPEPETVALSAEQGADVLSRDWFIQAEGENLLERTREEIGWARQMADRILKKNISAEA